MSTEEIIKLIKNYDVQSSFSHFSKEVTPPFITYLIDGTSNFDADDSVYYQVDNIRLELYTRENIIDEEKKLETYLTSNQILWEKTAEDWIDEEKVMMTVYELG
ncbi:MAG: hypothetical protein ACLRT4_13590 [Thomasclavelia sp.]